MNNRQIVWITFANHGRDEIVVSSEYHKMLYIEKLLSKIYGRENVGTAAIGIDELPKNLIEAKQAEEVGEVVDERFSNFNWVPF
jgi:hypothetical protein